MGPSICSLICLSLLSGAIGGSGLGILSSMNVRFIVIAPQGRRTGYDPDTKAEVSEIPSSHYGVKITGETDGAGGDRSRELGAAFASPDPLVEGAYTIRVFGETPGPFWLSISVYREPVSDDLNVRGTIRKGELKTYRVVYAADPVVPLIVDSSAAK